MDAKFQVGDKITGQADGAEIDGEIVSIEGDKAKVKTEWGTLTVDLTTAELKRTIEWYKITVSKVIGEEDGATLDAGVILLVAALEVGPHVDKVVAFTGFREEFVKKVLWRADIYDIFNGIKWHETDIDFMVCVLVVEGLADRVKNKDGEWQYKMLGTSGVDGGRVIVDGRTSVQRECTAIQNKHKLKRKEAWELWREKIIDIDKVSFDFSKDDPLGLNLREEAETVTPA